MEQWMKDGRHMLYERWQSMPGVVGEKSNPTSVRGVDDKVLELCKKIFTSSRLHACVSSNLLKSDTCKVADDDEQQQLHFKYCDGHFSAGIDRSGFFGLVQRSPSLSTSSSSDNSRPAPKPHSRVLVDYAWAFRGRLYDYTPGFSFVAGAGVVPQALEEAVLYCRGGQSVEALCDASAISDAEQKKELEDFREGFSFAGFEEFLCDGDFAFRDEGTRLPATDLTVGSAGDGAEQRVAVKAEAPAMLVPPDATVSLLVRVRKFCPPVSAAKHLDIAEHFKSIGNAILTGTEEKTKQQQQQHVDCEADDLRRGDSDAKTATKHTRARRFYERALQELSPEAMRGGTTDEKEIEAHRKLLASLSHNVSLCFYEDALSRPSCATGAAEKRELLKRSITLASEGVKVSQGTHQKCLFRRAAANVQLGNFEEAEADLKNMNNITPGSDSDASVVALRMTMQQEIRKSDETIRVAMKKQLEQVKSDAAAAAAKAESN